MEYTCLCILVCVQEAAIPGYWNLTTKINFSSNKMCHHDVVRRRTLTRSWRLLKSWQRRKLLRTGSLPSSTTLCVTIGGSVFLFNERRKQMSTQLHQTDVIIVQWTHFLLTKFSKSLRSSSVRQRYVIEPYVRRRTKFFFFFFAFWNLTFIDNFTLSKHKSGPIMLYARVLTCELKIQRFSFTKCSLLKRSSSFGRCPLKTVR